MKKSLSSKDKLKSVNQKPMQASGKISPRRKIPKEIKHSDSELTRIAFETALTANSIADKNGVIINANNSFLKTWGYSSLKDVIGKPIPFFIKYKKDVEQILQALNTNGKWEGNYTALRKDKTEFTAHGLATTLRDSSNNIIGYQSSVMDISDRKEIENNLIQSELRFRNIFNQSPVGAVIVSLEKKFIQCNHSFCQYLGYTDTELVGNYIADVTYPEDVNIGMPELKLMAEGRLDLALVHKRYVHKDGGIVWGEVTMTLVRNAENKPNYLLAIIQDITERRKAEEVQQSSEAKFKTIVNASPMGMHLYQMQGNELIFYGANPAADDVLGVDHASFIGKKLEDAFPGLINTEVPGKYKEVATRGNTWTTQQIEYNEGQIRGAFEVVAFQTEPGKMVALFNNITERKIYESELKRAKEKAEESDRLKSAFLQNMSHEIRTPMNAIIGFSELLATIELSDERRKHYCAIISKSSNQLLSIVTDILTISSLETHQEKVNYKPVSVNSIIRDLQTIFRERSENKRITLHATYPLSELESEVVTDETKLTQVLSNLITNAIKFTPEGYVEFGYILKNSELEFYVRDSGIGIEMEMQSLIFERFRQADLSISKTSGGTGLGLAISKAFVELLGGNIWVDSEIGKGSVFYFTIPYVNANAPHIEQPVQLPKITTATVLIAEDEEFNYQYLHEILHGMSFVVLRAFNGKDAVEQCRTNTQISMVLMDIKMPVMDGHTAARKIKEFRPNLPIIAQSAYALDHELAKFRGNEFNEYLKKPINKEELKKKICLFTSAVK